MRPKKVTLTSLVDKIRIIHKPYKNQMFAQKQAGKRNPIRKQDHRIDNSLYLGLTSGIGILKSEELRPLDYGLSHWRQRQHSPEKPSHLFCLAPLAGSTEGNDEVRVECGFCSISFNQQNRDVYGANRPATILVSGTTAPENCIEVR
jgi:hypothetical protein